MDRDPSGSGGPIVREVVGEEGDLEPGQRRHPERREIGKDADLRQHRGMEDAQGDRGGQTHRRATTPRPGQSSPAAFPKAAAAIAT